VTTTLTRSEGKELRQCREVSGGFCFSETLDHRRPALVRLVAQHREPRPFEFELLRISKSSIGGRFWGEVVTPNEAVHDVAVSVA
jgi:hypothetical protein